MQKFWTIIALVVVSNLFCHAQITLCPTGAVWKYLDQNTYPGNGWTELSFNDAGWASGAAPLGFGDPEATIINGGPSGARYITTYFRRTFVVTNVSEIATFAFRVRRDDGLAVYLNGRELFRDNLSRGPLTVSTFASSAISDWDEADFFTFSMPANHLTAGTNILAVELHQINVTSSDLTFDLELTCNRSQLPLMNVIADSAGGFSTNQGQSGWFYGYFRQPNFGQSSFIQLESTRLYDMTNRSWTHPNYAPPYTLISTHHETPASPAYSGIPVEYAVRRFMPALPVSVRIRNLVRANDTNTTGDGVVMTILNNNQTLLTRSVSPANTTGYHDEVSATLNPGQPLDFVVAPNANDANDFTYSVAQIIGTPQETLQTLITIDRFRLEPRFGTTLVDVYFDLLAPSEYEPFNIRLDASTNGARAFEVAPPALGDFSGDTGDGVLAGLNRHIVWNPGSSWFAQAGTDGVIRLRASASTRQLSALANAKSLPESGAVAVSAVRASWPGTFNAPIPISYTLSLSNRSAAQVSLVVSVDGGASFSVFPPANALSGDVGLVAGSGLRTLQWNPALTLPPGTFLANCKVRVIATGGGQSSSAVSPAFRLEVPGLTTTMTVAGRAVDAVTGRPLTNATVSIGGQSVTTSASGDYSLNNISPTAGSTLTITSSGQPTYTEIIAVAPGTRQVIVPQVRLAGPTVTGKPVVTGLRTTRQGPFVTGLGINSPYVATVNWNGGTPGAVKFYANSTLAKYLSASGNTYSAPIPLDQFYGPSFRFRGNQLTVIARSADGVESEPVSVNVPVIPMMGLLEHIFTYTDLGQFEEAKIEVGGDFPQPPIAALVALPVLGKFGAEFAFSASLGYDLANGQWEFVLGAGETSEQHQGIPYFKAVPPKKSKLFLGETEVEFKLEAGARSKATPNEGFGAPEIFGHAEVDVRFQLARIGMLDLLGPGASTVIGRVPGLNSIVQGTSIGVWAIPGLDGELVYQLGAGGGLKSMEVTGKVGIEADYEPNFGRFAKARFYAGGEPSVTLQYPGDLFKQFRFRCYAGLEFDVWSFSLDPIEYVFVDYSYPTPPGQSVSIFRPKSILVSGGGGSQSGWRTQSRAYLVSGVERFFTEGPLRKSAAAPGMTMLEAFRAMGTPKENVGEVAKGKGPSTANLAQANLPLLENVYPNSEPALASRGQELMLLYVADNGSSNSLQFTDIKWTRFDGTNWTTPANILADTRAEFAPQVVFDGNGNALAVWERVGNTNFTQTNLTSFAAAMEIVWSRWNRASGQWSTPVQLTTNSYLDHKPLLCGPMANGDVLFTSTRNASNELMGTNVSGITGNSHVFWRQWSAASQSWSNPLPLVTSLAFQLSESLAGLNNRAVYAWTRDLDGKLTNASDQQVFYREWTNGAWGTPVQFTTNTLGNQNVRAAVSSSGDAYLLWREGTNLVMNRNFEPTNKLVRSDSQTAGFTDYALTLGPGGNLALVWQEMSATGPDAHYRIYDPASDSWSRDARLFSDASLERSFAPVWDDAGNLTLAYNKVEILKTNKTLALEGGGSVTITNVPQPGRVDLAVVKRALIKDLALFAGDFTVTAENFLPGAALTLSAQVRNAGDVAVSNLTVGFYAGNPTSGGSLIASVAVPGWLEGGSNATASTIWVMPDTGATQGLFAVVDPANAVAEFFETNNTQSIFVGGIDLALSLLSATVETNGSMRVIAQVQNIGAPSAPASTVALRLAGQTNAPLTTANAPLLEPGRLAQVALDLPAGSVPEGERAFSLRADDIGVTGDNKVANNSLTFSINLFVDSDGDGMSDAWELAHGLNPTDTTDAAGDLDGDGLSNLAEYLAGTNPNDASSFLRIASIAGKTNGVQLTWGSAAGRLYTIERTTNIVSGWIPISTHNQGTPPQNAATDPSATNRVPYFYRLRIE